VNQLLLNAEGSSKPVHKEEKKSYTEIKVTIENDSIYKITLNRPDKLNALSIKVENAEF
jgi:1,4-dihydroxy-2-naphthoyl-CoA synthase